MTVLPTWYSRRVMPLNEVAQYMGVSVKTVRRIIQAGELPLVRQSFGRRGVRANEVDSYLDRHTVGVKDGAQ